MKYLIIILFVVSASSLHAGQIGGQIRKGNIVFGLHLNDNSGTTPVNISTSGTVMAFNGSGNAWVTGKYGSGLSFSGAGTLSMTDNFASVGKPIGGYTLAAWIRPALSGRSVGTQALFVKAGAGGEAIAFNLDTNKLMLRDNRDTPEDLVSNVEISSSTVGRMTFVVGRRISGVSKTIWIDGVFAGSSTATSTQYSFADTPEIACNAVCANNKYAGLIDEFFMWDVGLTDGEIKQLYVEGLARRGGDQTQ